MAKAWIEDLWYSKKTGEPTSRNGRGKRWRVSWMLDGAISPKSEAYRTKPEAEEARAKYDNDIRAGLYRDPKGGRRSFADVAAQWLKVHTEVSGSTRFRYERDLRTYVLPRFGEVSVGSITKADVAEFLADLQAGDALACYKVRGKDEHVARKMTRPLSPGSIKGIHVVLGAVLGWAVDTDLVPTKVSKGVKRPKQRPQRQTYLTHQEVARLADAAGEVSGNPCDRAMVLTMAYTGIRIGEAAALTVGDLDLPGRLAHVAQTWTVDHKGRAVLGPCKHYEIRDVPLLGFLASELTQTSKDRAASDPVFRALRGGTVSINNWRNRVWASALKAAKLDHLHLTPHDLRHTAVSMAVAAGADVKVVQQMLGHADASVTLNTYATLWPNRLSDVADAMDGMRTRELAESNVVPLRTKAG